MHVSRNSVVRIALWVSLLGVEQPLVCEAQTAGKTGAAVTNFSQRLSEVEKAVSALQAASAAADQQKLSERLSALEKALAGSHPALTAEEGEKLNERLSAIEKAQTAQPASLISDEQKGYLNGVAALKASFDAVQQKMAETAEHLAGSEMSISYNYFTIFGMIFTILLALLGLIGSGAAVFIRRVVFDSVTKDIGTKITSKIAEVDQQIEVRIGEVEKEMSSIARFESDIAMAETSFKMSFAWWEQYEKDFRKFLQRRKTMPDIDASRELPEATILELRMARILSERGMKIASSPSFMGPKEDERPWVIRARLTNLLIYNATSELLCRGAAATIEEKLSIIDQTELLLGFARDKRASQKQFWYNFHETAAFAMTNLGNEGTQERGRALVRDLLAMKTPGEGFEQPPEDWLAQVRSEYHVDVPANSETASSSETPRQ